MKALRWVTLGLLCTAILAVPTTFRRVVWTASVPPAPRIYAEFSGVVIFLPDLALIGLLALSALRALSPAFRREMGRTLRQALQAGAPPWLALIGWLAFSATWAFEPRLSLYAAAHALLACWAGLLLTHETRQGGAVPVLYALLTGAVLQGALAFLQVVNRGPLGLGWLGETSAFGDLSYRGTGLAVHPNNLAGYLMMAGCALLVWLADRRSARAFLLAIPVGLGLLATFSRAGMLALGVAGLIWLWEHRARLPLIRLRAGKYRALRLTALIGALAIGGALLLQGGWARIANLSRDFRTAGAAQAIRQFPLTGVGAGSSTLFGLPYETESPVLPVHNTYLLMLAEGGPVACGLLIWGVAAAIRRRRTAPVAGIMIGIACVMWFDYYFWGDHRARLAMFLILGLVWGELPLSRTDTASPAPQSEADRRGKGMAVSNPPNWR